MKTYIGIDLGGTNVRVCKIMANGNILQEVKSLSYGMEGPEVVIENLVKLIKSIDAYQECSGIGIGVPGPVDTVNKVMKISSNLKGFTDYPIAKVLEEKVGLPVFVDNDANVAGLAEALVGAGKGLGIVYYVTISTGIGGALIVNGKLISGKSGYAGETGNMIVDPYRKPFNNLNPGASESEASGRALTRKGKELFGEDAIQNAGDVFALAASGNSDAQKLIDQMTTDLAILFSHVAHIVDPHMFVIGGGVLKSKAQWFDTMIEKFKTFVHPGMRDVKFEVAKLEEPGIVGAAMLPVSNGL
ncbi:ROK family protein [Erysipelotrichaceae bacterium OH741_COT-311]|nr:ROK family protein [Erysipelotrichaceae bacterium OH741_COT-311]